MGQQGPSDDESVDVNVGLWFVMHPDELIASFYIPLPEPIGLPEGAIFRDVENLEHTSISVTESAAPELMFGRERKGGFELTPLPDEFIPGRRNGGDPTVYWANKVVLSTSVIVHQAKANLVAKTSLDAALAVSNASSGEAMDISKIAELAEGMRTTVVRDAEETLGDLGATTIFECAVGLRLLGEISGDDSVMLPPLDRSAENLHPQESDEVYPDIVSMWTWSKIGKDVRSSQDVLVRRMHNSLDIALNACRKIQLAYHVATDRAVSMIYRERLPFILPVIVRKTSSIGKVQHAPVRLTMMVNGSAKSFITPEIVRELETVYAIRRQLVNAPLLAYRDLRREALSAFYDNGDLRATVIFAAVAAESFLDTILLHLMWEEKLTPEIAASNWSGKLSNRVKRDFQARLGGVWDLTRSGLLKDWHVNVGNLRNRVVHGAYLPNIDEAELALRSLDGLVKYFVDVLGTPRNVSRYPRTCLALLPREEITRRNLWTRRFSALLEDPNEPPWQETFGRWRECWRKLRQDANDIERVPESGRASLLAVFSAGDDIEWVQHDRTVAKVRRVFVNTDDLSGMTRGQLAAIKRQIGDINGNGRYSTFLHDSPPFVPLSGEEWVEEYHLVPMAEVMVDRSDYIN
jgi:hypothetical protein